MWIGEGGRKERGDEYRWKGRGKKGKRGRRRRKEI